jgi:hypothetical protein
MAIQSLFGPSPAQVLEQRRKEQEQSILQQGREFGVFAPLYQAGLRFGEQGRQSMQGLFPGQQDAALQEATAVQSVLAKYADQDQSNPEILSQIGRELLPIAPNAGMKALMFAKELGGAASDPRKQAQSNVLRILSTPPELRTEEDQRILDASQSVLGQGADDVNVQSSKQYLNGTVVKVMRDGSVKVTSPDGVDVTGTEARKVINDAAEFEVRQAGAKSGAQAGGRLSQEAQFAPDIESGRQAGKTGQELASNAFKQSGLISSNIENLRTARRALQEGAQSGVIAERFPDWKASTIELRNVKSRLGLDIVGSVTFGSLTKNELDLALDLGLPTKMAPKELIGWIDRKVAAQEKLVSYLDEQARFLSVQGRTLNDWLNEVDRRGRERKNIKIQTPGGKALTVEQAEQRLRELQLKQRGTR